MLCFLRFCTSFKNSFSFLQKLLKKYRKKSKKQVLNSVTAQYLYLECLWQWFNRLGAKRSTRQPSYEKYGELYRSPVILCGKLIHAYGSHIDGTIEIILSVLLARVNILKVERKIALPSSMKEVCRTEQYNGTEKRRRKKGTTLPDLSSVRQ